MSLCTRKIAQSKEMLGKNEYPSASAYRVGRNNQLVKNPCENPLGGCPCKKKTLNKLAVGNSGPCLATLCALPSDQPDCPQPYVGDDPICAVGSLGVRINGPNISGEYEIMPRLFVIIESDDNINFKWSANRKGITAVTVQAGPNQYTYAYSGDTLQDSGLHPPLNASCELQAIHHIDICFNPSIATLDGLKIVKTANTRYQKKFAWSIQKTADKSILSLSLNQVATVNYLLSAGFTEIDSNWEVFGSITVSNENGSLDLEPIIIDSVTDLIPGGVVTITPSITFPYPLNSGESVTFDYVAVMTGSGAGTNTAVVGAHVGSSSRVFTAVNGWDFLSPSSIELSDEFIQINDSLQGDNLVTFSAMTNDPKLFSYSSNIGPFIECGEYIIDNKASFVTIDTGASGSASWTVRVTVDCPPSTTKCVSGKNYWIRRSGQQRESVDVTWSLLPGGLGPNTLFFSSGKTYYQILKADPGTNPYYILARQYIVAQLNLLRGTDSTPIQSVFNQATDFFLSTTISQVLNKKGNDPLRKLVLNLTDALRDYNKGRNGPARCKRNSAKEGSGRGSISPFSGN